MKFTLIIQAAPDSQGSQSALSFAQALLRAGHEIHRLFFYGQGIHNATTLAVTPQDEPDITNGWQKLIKEHQLDAVICIAAGLRRGVINDTEANRYEKSAHNMNPAFELSGLGQLLEAAVRSDRVMTFGE